MKKIIVLSLIVLSLIVLSACSISPNNTYNVMQGKPINFNCRNNYSLITKVNSVGNKESISICLDDSTLYIVGDTVQLLKESLLWLYKNKK